MDVVQNAICKALENYMSMRNPQAVKTWFYRIILNETFGFQRKSAREIAYDPAAPGFMGRQEFEIRK